jgi:hypothetical protein
VHDGVDWEEANAIAQSYFRIHVGCGAIDTIEEKGKCWAVRAVVGFAAEHVEGFCDQQEDGQDRFSIGTGL